ncbi:MAG TPA: amino acid adenylation domain-containing protein, partial [Acidimicrobiales bacterium]|nr:amino acid adenylation domain-containing protein [Acidimicrobiales bacterium]
VPVGVALERTPGYIVALLAILKAGGAYVPLDPEAPAERTRYVVADSQMRLLLAAPALADTVRGAGAEVLTTDDIRGALDHNGHEGSLPPSEDGFLGYVIYTSGSTGRPKGVMVERGAISAHCRTVIVHYELDHRDRVLQFSQYSADASLEQILPTLATGALLVMRGSEIWTPGKLLDELVEHRVTIMNFSPSYFRHVASEWTRSTDPLDRLRLRLVILGGERLGAATVSRWRALGLDRVRLLNAYGPTEATITATVGAVEDEGETITIGRPLPGRLIRVLDDDGLPVPAGEAGELHIGGALLARGYLGRPELTGERFVPDPGRPGGRLYKTGDLVRCLGDGRIEYLGRRDEQVQVRGYRVELGEVEAALEQHRLVAEAVVLPRSEGDDVGLVAYVVAEGGGEVPEDDLWAHLERTLPRQMHPMAVVQLDALPRLATGKPDRRTLQAREPARGRNGRAHVAPRGLAERRLVDIWEELLESRPIGIRDNFFHLGGHSLLAAQLVSRVEQSFGRPVPLSTLFAHPTVEQLVAVLEEGAGDERPRPAILGLQAEGTRRPFFFLHGDWTGAAFYCFALARACHPDQPFYAVAPHTFGEGASVPTVEEMAAGHMDAIRSVQAEGPYRLGGFCNGGLLAYEMARQVEAAGEQVEFLGLINPSEPVQGDWLWRACRRAGTTGTDRGGQRAHRYLRARHVLRHLYRRVRPGGGRVLDFPQLLAVEPRLGRILPPIEALYRDYVGVFSTAAAAYRTGIFGGKISLYWARDEPGIARTWDPVLAMKNPRDVEERLVPGTHMTCITEGIGALAAILAADLDRLEQRFVVSAVQVGEDGHG